MSEFALEAAREALLEAQRIQAQETAAVLALRNALQAAEERGAALEIALDRERTGRLQVAEKLEVLEKLWQEDEMLGRAREEHLERRVAELEAALTWAAWLGPGTPARGITEIRFHEIVAESAANHRARQAGVVPDDVCPDCREDGANCTCAQEDPQGFVCIRCGGYAAEWHENNTRCVACKNELKAALRASVEAAERKRGGRRG